MTEKREDGSTVTAQTIVAQHRGDIPIGTLRAIERQMEQFSERDGLK